MTTRWDRGTALLLLGLAIYTIAAALDMSYTDRGVPGPGFAPFWIGVALTVASLAILRRSRGSQPPQADASRPAGEPGGPGQGRILAAVAGVTLAAVALIQVMGMVAALTLLLLGLVRILGGPWRTAGLAAVGLSLALYAIFGLWLQVPLPRGPLGF